MFEIKCNNKIELTKGDSATILVEVVDGNGAEYTIKDTDVVTMTVKSNENASTASILKTADSNHIITLLPADTSSLTSGLYVYDIQIRTAENNVYTIIPISAFQLNPEVSNG